MSFASLSFLCYLPIVFLIYWLFAKRLQWQNLFILSASYVFYGWWDWRFLILIFITSLSSYVSGLALELHQHRKIITGANILFNLLILACFKYYNFFVDNLQAIAEAGGISLDMPTLKLILPVGISFYTFQSLSYTIDVFRRRIPATHDPLAFFSYICFFPQLVAGPIERASDLLPQMLHRRRFVYSDAVDGLRQMLWGFFKKLVVADNCALAVNMIYDNWQHEGALTLAFGMVFFSFQIYGDFSGYSDIAIGVARLFGIHLSDNFRQPYFSRSIAEFWRRWHITLMTWFRDYVYIPLGGSRCGRWKSLRNTFLVFALSGLWHGANWTFIVWGLYHFLLFVPSILSGRQRAKNLPLPSYKDMPAMLLTFLLVTIGWVVFRADSIGDAIGYLYRLATSVAEGNIGLLAVGKTAIVWCLLLIIIEWSQRSKRHALEFTGSLHTMYRWSIYYILLFIIIFFHGEEQTFIYFQF